MLSMTVLHINTVVIDSGRLTSSSIHEMYLSYVDNTVSEDETGVFLCPCFSFFFCNIDVKKHIACTCNIWAILFKASLA